MKLPLLLALVLALVQEPVCAEPSPDERVLAFVSLQALEGSESRRFRAELARGGDRRLPKTQGKSPPPLPLFFDDANPDACANTTLTALPLADFAMVALRGNCSFADKAAAAIAFGARVLFVANTVDSLYGTNGTAEAYLRDPCATDCSESQSDSQTDCEAGCGSGLCAANPRARAGVSAGSFCCAINSVLPMELPPSPLKAFFVGVADADALVAAASDAQPQRVQVFAEDKLRVDGSVVLVLLLGTAVTALASYRAARKERARVRWVWKSDGIAPTGTGTGTTGTTPGPGKDEDPDAEIESVTLNAPAVVCFLAFCTASLIGLFYLAINFPRETVITVQVFFGLGSVYALSYFVLQPLVRAAWPGSVARPVSLRGRALGTADTALAYALAATTVCVWFAFRHASWAWVLLDLLGASVCCMFLVTIRVPHLRVATLALALFFVYDVFMVFISPELFGGKSVMVEVATAGGSTATVDPADNTVCARTQAERMPMLFMVPRFDGNGFALLGLGDVFLPGLLLTYGCRVDYLRAEKEARNMSWARTHRYFLPLVAAYGTGLALALLANVLRLDFSTKVQGQPALLYLVPLTLGVFVALAWARGDLPLLWGNAYEDLQRRLLTHRGSDDDDAESGATQSSSAAEVAPRRLGTPDI